MYKTISYQENNGDETTIEQVKECLKEFGTLNYDKLDNKERLQLADALQVCASVIGELAYETARKESGLF